MTLLQCSDCPRQFATTDKLEAHLWRAHITAESQKTACPVCDLPLTEGNYRNHLSCLYDFGESGVFNQLPALLCPICGEGHTSEDELEAHLDGHDGLEFRIALGDTSGCQHCGTPLTPENTGDHLECFVALTESDTNTDGEFACPFDDCNDSFNTVGKGLLHISTSHFEGEGLTNECPGCNQTFSFGETPMHLACRDDLSTRTAGEYISHGKHCLFCGHSSFSSAIIHGHYYSAHLPSNDKCPGCGEAFEDPGSSELLDHIACVARWKNHYPLEQLNEQWPCPVCDEVCEDGRSFENHLLDKHADELRDTARCEFCDESLDGATQHTDCLVEMGRKPDTETQDRQIRHRPVQSHNSAEYFNTLRKFIDREKETARDEAWDRYESQPLERVLRTQSSIPELLPVGEQFHPDHEHQIVYQVATEVERDTPRNIVKEYGIYPGNEVILGGAGVPCLPRAAVVTFVDTPSIGFALRPSDGKINDHVIGELTADDTSYHCVELINPTPFDRERDAVDTTQQTERYRNIVLGNATTSETPVSIPDSAIDNLNQYQQQAVERALGTNEFLCIHGPPGTGKTRTLTRIIRLAIARGDRILATAHSNQAIDNLLAGTSTPRSPDTDSLHQVAHPAGRDRTLPRGLQQELEDNPDDETLQETATQLLNRPREIAVARVGDNSTSDVVRNEYMGADVRDADLVTGTMSALANLDQSEKFDLVVVDEASQATQPATFIPFLRGECVVLAGDHLQLPPYAADEQSKEEEMHESLFEHLLNTYGTDASVMLQRQYRMNEQIADFPSEHIYDGRLETGEPNKHWTISDLKPIMAVDINGDEQTDEMTHSKYNPAEADIVANHVKLLTMHDVPMGDIGIITPYSAQIKTIRRAVQNTVGDINNLKINTVDSFQGSEREAIIVSFVRSNPGNHTGFLALPEEGKRRLNVALTRGKKRLVLIGDWNTLGTPASYEESDSTSNLYAALYSSLNDKDLIKESRVTGTAD